LSTYQYNKSSSICYGEINILQNTGVINKILKFTNLDHMFITHRISIGFYNYGQTITYDNVKSFDNVEFVECIQSNIIPVVITRKDTNDSNQDTSYFKGFNTEVLLEKLFGSTFTLRIKKSPYNCVFFNNSVYTDTLTHCVFGMGCLMETNEKSRYVFGFNPYFLNWEEVGYIICKIFSEAE
jgi:hypothetical protein